MKTVFSLFLRGCLLLAIASGSGAGGLGRANDAAALTTANFQIPGLFLTSSDPATGATDVAVNKPVKFTFFGTLATDNQVTWSPNVNAADIVCSQSVESILTVLTCTPKTVWPVGVITWDLSSFKAADGTPILDLPTAPNGQFTTSSSSSTNNPCDPTGGSKTAGFTIFKRTMKSGFKPTN